MSRKKPPIESITDDDITLFRSAFKKIAPIKKQEKVLLKKKSFPPKKISADDFDNPPFPYLSDQQIEDFVTPEQKIFYSQQGVSPKQVRQLKQGKIPIMGRLDLHGFDVESAREALVQFIEQAYQNQKRYVMIIHGKGHTEQPILKNKINNWLRQLDHVLAFCTAQPKQGGAGAVYVLLRSK